MRELLYLNRFVTGQRNFMSTVKREAVSGKVDTRIGNSTSFKGTIVSEGNVTVEGKIKGTIECKETVVVKDGGCLEGALKAEDAFIAGHVDGNITARNVVEITSSGKVKGDIDSSSLTIAQGVVFDGNCHMNGNAGGVSGRSVSSKSSGGVTSCLFTLFSKLFSKVKDLLGVKNIFSSS
jgi:cytoskeletal protein CcmA (bactofilin family)